MKRLWKRVVLFSGLPLILGCLSFVFLCNSDVWTMLTLFKEEARAENFRNFHTIFPSREIGRENSVWAFESDLGPLPEFYTFEGRQRRVAEFLERTSTTGIAVAQDAKLLHEAYFQGYDQSSLPTSFSVAKSFLSALVGISIAEGYIASVLDTVERHVPALAGTGYGQVQLRHLLTMSSGVDFDEDYEDPRSDINVLPTRLFLFRDSLPDLMKDVELIRESGTLNRYSSSDSMVLGLVLESATGTSAAQFLRQMIWEPAGMEHVAYWGTDFQGNVLAYGFLSASLRDYLRFGRLYLNHGVRDGEQVIPEEWVQRSVSPQVAHLKPGENAVHEGTFGYGYQWWIPEGQQGDYAAIGIWGQYIYIHTGFDVVIAKTSADEEFAMQDRETIEVFRSIARWAEAQ